MNERIGNSRRIGITEQDMKQFVELFGTLPTVELPLRFCIEKRMLRNGQMKTSNELAAQRTKESVTFLRHLLEYLD